MIGIPRGSRRSLPKGEATAYLHSIRHQIAANVGKWAILKEKDGRNISACLIQIVGVTQGRCSYYNCMGDIIGHQLKTIDVIAIMTNDAQLVFLDAV